MSEPALSIDTPEFRATTAIDGARMIVAMHGDGTVAVVPALYELFVGVHERCREKAIAEVCVDLKGVEFLNSSCFNVLVNWIRSIRLLDQGCQYHIRFIPDEKSHWQKTSLRVLATFGKSLVAIDE